MGPLAWIGLAILGLLLLLVGLLALPVELRLSVEHRDGTRARGELTWLFGRVHLQLFPTEPADPETAPPGGHPEGAPDGPPEPPPERTPEPLRDRLQRGRTQGRAALSALRTPGFTAALRRWLGRLLRSIHLHLLRGWLRFGTGDPAETGRAFGYAQAALPASYLLEAVDLEVQPDFREPVFEAEGELRLRATPLRLLVVTLAFALTPATWRAVRSARAIVKEA